MSGNEDYEKDKLRAQEELNKIQESENAIADNAEDDTLTKTQSDSLDASSSNKDNEPPSRKKTKERKAAAAGAVGIAGIAKTIKTSIPKKMKNIKSKIPTAGQSIKNGVKHAGIGLVSGVKSAPSRIINGIKSFPGRVVATSKKIANNVVNAAKKVKGAVLYKYNDIKEDIQIRGDKEAQARKAERKKAEKEERLKQKKARKELRAKSRANKKKHKVLKGFLIAVGAAFAIFLGYAIFCVASAPSIDTDNLYSNLQVSSVMYDDQGEAINSVFSDENRSLVEYKDLPKNLINAFIAIEDKTFWSHNGFNITRIFGAIKDSIFGGSSISGTSTITQQLARNLYLPDEKSERSIRRKIVEAYYTIIMEATMSKEEIITAYLNTISLGFHSYGVQSASRAYFNKDVSQLTLEECAALAALPQAPSRYALVIECKNSELNKNDVIVKKGSSTSFILNDVSKDRRETCLQLMLDQELITQEEYDKAISVPLENMINPNSSSFSEHSANYFSEYIVNQIIEDLQDEGYSYDAAYKKIYSEGLKIYTTIDAKAQAAIDEEFANPDNFPGVGNYKSDSDNNVVDEEGNILLYDYDNFFDEEGRFTLHSDEFSFNNDGSLTINYGKRLNIYKTSVQGGIEYSLEFKNLYTIEDGRFFSIAGGYINIPAKYKKADSDMNLIVTKEFFDDYPEFFTKTDDGELRIENDTYTLSQKVVQPQGAMVIRDVTNGQIKAMAGGRELAGQQLMNRANSPRQPGSSIKPITVYSAALQYSADAVAQGRKGLDFVDPGGTAQGAKWWGNFLTAASAVVDEKMTTEGKVWPINVTKSYSGVISMRQAIKNSVNVSAVKIFQQIGADYANSQLKKFGITTGVSEGNPNDLNAAAMALGGFTNGVTPLEMSNAFAAFVNGGKIFDSSCYTKVEDASGKVILEKDKPESTEALDPGVAWITRDMMFDVVGGGTGSQASISGVKVGGKTGTTSNEYDIWFNGFTPTYSASLWIGNDMNMELTSMSDYAARLWSRIMSQIPKACQGEYSDQPDNVVSASVDSYSGGAPGSGSTKNEYFIKGTEPTETISIGKFDDGKEEDKDKEKDKEKEESKEDTIKVCVDTDYYATPACPHTKDVKLSDIPEQLKYYCNRHNPDPEKYPTAPPREAMITNEMNERRENRYLAFEDLDDMVA